MSRIRECFTSRWLDGNLLEVDYSQLEIVALATLTKDSQLIADLKSGEDLHRLRASEWLKKAPSEVTDIERFNAKRLSFMLQYGSGANNMARQLKIPKRECTAFIQAFYERYPSVGHWQEEIVKKVKEGRQVDGRTVNGTPRGVSTYVSITGRCYTFSEYDSKFSDNPNFSPTEMKNYPVQGFATGDIMKIALGELAYSYGDSDKELLINTVHDSIMFDLHPVVDVDSFVETINKILTKGVEQKLKSRYGIELLVPLSVDFKVGKVWSNMTGVDIAYL